VKRGFIGVSYTELDAANSKELGINEINGLYVNSVIEGGGAAIAGLKKGDVLTKVEGNNIYSSSDLQERVGRLRPGDKLRLSYLREGKENTVSVTLKPESSLKVASNNKPEAVKNLGAAFSPLSADQKKKYNVSQGVVVTSVRPGGFFDQLELPIGTIIVSVNGQLVKNGQEVNDALSASRNNLASINAITPDGSKMKYQFQIR
ncbi:MAG: protease Do, partial [Daejeonella sp.]|nr:protease Do [Daejeonella sp.]